MTDSTGDQANGPGQIGPYRLLELLGEGGMGDVWLAEQKEPVHRRVALKIIKLGMDTKQVLARLEAERQALAVMDHPNIARFFDGGATETGRPYFVMELVRGIPITGYCDKNRLTTEERIRLFIDVCKAVQHAHHKGVVHRDLKPSNVLVGVKDNDPVVKIIDFGIAKAIGQDLTDRTLVTRMGQMIGTPEYMSPEQAEMSGLDLDTRTDVYSLGVMLYELLVGALPFDLRKRWDRAIRVAIRDSEVPRPSTKLSSLGKTQDKIAEYRRTTPSALKRGLKTDLDWIILKAMEKDRTRRYETANGLALDLERHLNDEPILARAPSARYRLGKFLKRHRAGVAASAVVLAALVGGLSLATIGMVRAQRAERRAEQEAEAARQVSDFLVELFKVNDPSEARGNAITAREILDRGAERIESELGEQPLVQARLLRTMGEVFMSLGLYEQAESMLEDAVDLDRENLDPGHPQSTLSTFELGRLLHKQGRYDEAEVHYRETVESLEAAGAGEDARLATALDGLGNLMIEQGRYDEAEGFILRGLSMLESGVTPDSIPLADNLEALGTLRSRQGDWEGADTLFERTLAIREAVLGATHPDVAHSLSNLGAVRWRLGRRDEAEQLLRRSLDVRTDILGPDHPDLGANLLNLGILLFSQEKFAEAEEHYRRAIEIWEGSIGSDHIRMATALNNLARLYWLQGNQEDAESLYLRALDIKQRILEPDDISLAATMHGLAAVYHEQGRFSEAEPLFQRALTIWEAVPVPDRSRIARGLRDFAAMLRDWGQPARADSLELRAQEISEGTGTESVAG